MLDILTLGIFFLFYMNDVSLEIESFSKKKGISYPLAYVLGLITFLLVPVVWFANRADVLNKKAKELGIEGKITTFDHAFYWNFFGWLILVGPFLATYRFFDTLNKIEIRLNEIAEEEAKEALEEPQPAEEPVADEEPVPKVEEKLPEPAKPIRLKNTPEVHFDPHYAGISAKTWSVKIDGRVHYFYRQSEAIAFAQKAARERGVNVTVKGAKK